MRILRNRVVISLILIALATYFWEFWIKPVTGPIYTEAVREYKNRNYTRSLQLLRQAHRVDPNDTAILALMGWNYLKMGDPKTAEEPFFRRAHELSPQVVDITLGYAYTEIDLGKYELARLLLDQLRQAGVDSADMHVAEGTYYRQQGRYRDAAREFKAALQREENNLVATKNLQELLNTADVRDVNLELPPYERPAALTYPARVEGDYFSWRTGNQWRPAYIIGVDLTPALPGSFPAEAVTDSAVYLDWLTRISDLGANCIRVYNLLPPAFYRALREFNSDPGHRPLWLLQGISFTQPPRDDMFNGDYYQSCQKDLRDAIDVIHGRGSVAAGNGQSGGVYTDDISEWVAGFLVGQAWLPHVVTANNQLHPDMRSYQGTYVEVPAGSPTEIFLAQMINSVAQYEEEKYNWQHPVAFLNWPTLDPIRHPTESTMLEEVSIRRAMGEHLKMPAGPYDDDDAVSVDPTHLKARPGFAAGYFAAYSVLPYYPDFLNRDPRYLAVRDAEGSNPFLGYLQDLIAHHRGLPLLVADYGIPTSLGIGHFSPAGFDEGGETEAQQGQLLGRLTRSVRGAGAAGGTMQEWLDQWYRPSWVQHNYETPPARRVLWNNFMNPAEHFGLMAADPGRRKLHLLGGDPAEWGNTPPFYAEFSPALVQAVGDRFDPARDLKALYVDADEGFLYLRLVVAKLDNDGDGQPDWKEVNYLIGVGTSPNRAGLTSLPLISRVPLPMGMTYAIQLAGTDSGQILIASSYNPFQIVPVDGIPTQSSLLPKLGWKPSLSDSGSFEPQIGEPNRRRFARDGQYFPPQRYDRGALRYGALNHQMSDYNSLAEWHANVQTNTIDLRIPWNLLNVTDPSSLKIYAGTEKDGTVLTADTPGFVLAAFSFRPPAKTDRGRSIMAQNSLVVDALPGMTGPRTMESSALKEFRWAGWDAPHYDLRPKDSIAILRKAFQSLPAAPPVGSVASKASASLSDKTKQKRSQAGGVSRSGR
jgi:tetratricopeptide (TPR) repeat protein